MKQTAMRAVHWLMHRRVRWLAAGLMIFVIGAPVAFWLSEPSLGVSWRAGSQLRIAKISVGTNHSFSTEPFWKQTARRILPRSQQPRLGPVTGQQFQRPYETLMVWIGEHNATTGGIEPPLDVEVSVVLADGVTLPGELRRGPGKFVSWEFQHFRRDGERIELRFRSSSPTGTNAPPCVLFAKNPRPVRPANWRAQPLPHTNRLPHTEIILSRLQAPRFDGRVSYWPAQPCARAMEGASAGWVDWRATTFDASGNWTQGRYLNRWGQPAQVPLLPFRDGGTWKLLFEGMEYISNGLVPEPANGVCHFLEPSARAKQFGVQFLVLAGPGSYRIVNGRVIEGRANLPADTHVSMPFSNLDSLASGTLALTTPAPGILCVSRLERGALPVRARLRERIGPDGGRIFRSQKNTSVGHEAGNTRWVAEFFPVRLPAVTVNLELEVIATLPPTEFFVSSAELTERKPPVR